MFRKVAVGLALSAGVLGVGASSAFALDCANMSRPAPAQPTTPVADFSNEGGPTIWVVQGDWWYLVFDGVYTDGFWDKIPPGTAANVLGLTPQEAASLGLPAGTINGNYQGGSGYGLLDNAQAPCNANRQSTNGIQAGSNRCPMG